MPRRSGGEEDQAGPERTCIVTRAKGSPDDMLRFVVAPDARVVPDVRHKLPGRGLWVTARADLVAEAVRKQLFARGFKAKVSVSEALPEEIYGLLVKDCLQSLSLANKAGQVTAGFGKVEAAIEEGTAGVLIHASDGAADGIRKLSQVLHRRGAGGTPQFKLFTSAQLDLALGRTNVIHAALTDGAASRNFAAKCARLEFYRSSPINECTSPPATEAIKH
jgi:uncharacterized protein